MSDERPSHHRADGRFANPWPDSAHAGTPRALLKWQWQRLRNGRDAVPDAGSFPLAAPRIERPRAPADESRVTWLGQSGFLLQMAGCNLLTDPLLSERASPFETIGPRRVAAAPVTVADMPPLDAVIISHDHYDHLDRRTIAALLERFGKALPFFTPLGYTAWFRKLGATQVTELDWWQTVPAGPLELTCLPAQHWTRRGLDTGRRLWSSWLVRSSAGSLYFCGDSGYCPAFADIRERVGAPDIALMPIGAYEPRWFMKPAHMNPEDAVQAFIDLGARDFVAMHWGTFHLTDEPMLEPPVRTRSAWHTRNLPDDKLHIPKPGETLTWRAGIRSTT